MISGDNVREFEISTRGLHGFCADEWKWYHGINVSSSLNGRRGFFYFIKKEGNKT